MTFERYLEELADVGRPLTTSRMTRLSGLSTAHSNKLAAAWPAIPAPRKERIVRLLIELSEDSVELDFEEVFRLCLDDPAPAMRVAGVDGLFECNERWLLDRLLLMVRNDESVETRVAAAEALGRFTLLAEVGDLSIRDVNRIDETLLAVFEDQSESVDVRRRALESLGVRSMDKVSTAIRKAYASDEHETRLGAVYAMGQSCDEQWVSMLVRELASDDPEMRYEATIALGEIEDERAVPYLVPLLRDDDLQVRLSTIASLGHIGGARAKEELMRCLRDPDEQISEAAEEALEDLTFNENPLAFGLGEDRD